jgi:DNA polymerase-3 subunit delta'
MILPWQASIWERLTGALGRLPHALLLAGPAGSGKRLFAEALARRLLCERAGGSNQACGGCTSCQWFDAGNHPDFRRVVPESELEEAEEAGDETETAADASDTRRRKPSQQILVDQVRALNGFVGVGTHRQGMRLILIDPAEAMNLNTANALLKLLEEPTPSTLFLLISRAPGRLLPTIRSRCQGVAFPKPDAAAARQWLAAQPGIDDPEAWLAFTGGMPLAAAALAAEGTSRYRAQLIGALTDIERSDPLQTAASWEGWLKQKQDAGFVPRLAVLVGWMQKWVFDLVSCKLAGRCEFYPDAAPALKSLAGRASVADLLGFYTELGRMRRIAEHPLNARLFLEDMLLRYGRAVAARGVADG